VGEIHSVEVPKGQYPWFVTAAAANVPRLAISCAVSDACSIAFFDLHLPPVVPQIAAVLQPGEIARMTCHNPVVSVSLAPDGHSCVSAAQREVQIWTLPEGRRAQRVLLDEQVRLVRHSPAGDRIAAVDVKGQVSLWQTPQLEPIARWDSGVAKPELLVFSPDGQWLAVADDSDDDEHTLVVRETTTGRNIARVEDKKCLKHAAFLPMPGGWRLLRVLTNGSGHEARCVIEPLLGEGKKQRFTMAGDPGGSDSIYCTTAFLLPGKGMLAAFDEVFICVHFFDIATGKNLRNLPLGEVRVRTLSASLDGHVVALAGGDMAFMKRRHDHSVHLIGTMNHHEFAQRVGHTDTVNEVAVSESGEFVLSGSADLTLRLWKARP
jgi:WD40 repeat protein